MIIISFKLDDELLKLLDIYATKHGMTRSEAIRNAIKKMVEEEIEKDLKIDVKKLDKLW